MVHRSAAVQVEVATFREAVETARLLFDRIWECTPDTRPFDLRQAVAQPGKKGWLVTVDAEDA